MTTLHTRGSMSTSTSTGFHQVGFRIPYRHYRDLKDEVRSLRYEKGDIRQEQVIGAALMAFQAMRESDKVRWINCYRRESAR